MFSLKVQVSKSSFYKYLCILFQWTRPETWQHWTRSCTCPTAAETMQSRRTGSRPVAQVTVSAMCRLTCVRSRTRTCLHSSTMQPAALGLPGCLLSLACCAILQFIFSFELMYWYGLDPLKLSTSVVRLG